MRRNIVGRPLPAGCQALPLRQYAGALCAIQHALQHRIIRVGNEIWRMQCSKPTTAIDAAVRLSAQWMGHRVALWFPTALLQRSLQACLPEMPMLVIPPPLFTAITSNVLGNWLQQLPQAATLLIDEVQDQATLPPEDTRSRLYLQTHCSTDAISYPIVIELSTELSKLLAPLCQTPSDPNSNSDASRSLLTAALLKLVLPLQNEIGRVLLPATTLRSLHLGDILFFDSDSSQRHGGLHVRLSYQQHPLLDARIEQPGQMVITGIAMNDNFLYEDELPDQPDTMQDDLPPYHSEENDYTQTVAAAHGDPLATLPLNVVFDVGNCEMTLAELQKLQAGSVIPMPGHMPEVVRISVNGQQIGSGELVEVDGRLGVMLARLAPTL